MGNKHREILRLKAEYKDQLPKPNLQWPYRIQRSVQFLHKHLFNSRLTVQWLKEECNITSKNFSSTFGFFVGKSPKQYWLSHRIKFAKILLLDNNLRLSITDIALYVGFNSNSAFTMMFKSYTAIPPTKYVEKFK